MWNSENAPTDALRDSPASPDYTPAAANENSQSHNTQAEQSLASNEPEDGLAAAAAPQEASAEAGGNSENSQRSGPIFARDTEYADILGDIEIPEGVDPSFLAALPEDMRQEVISEHMR